MYVAHIFKYDIEVRNGEKQSASASCLCAERIVCCWKTAGNDEENIRWRKVNFSLRETSIKHEHDDDVSDGSIPITK